MPQVFRIVLKKLVARRNLRHVVKQVLVRLELIHALQHEIHRLRRIHLGKQLAQNPDALALVPRIEQVIAAGSGKQDVDGREDPAVRKGAVKLDFAVAGTLELLEYHIVHLGAGLGERGRQDGERTASLDVAGGTEEALGLLKGVGVHTSGQNLA